MPLPAFPPFRKASRGCYEEMLAAVERAGERILVQDTTRTKSIELANERGDPSRDMEAEAVSAGF